MSTGVLKALPGKLDIKRHSPSILYVVDNNPAIYCSGPKNVFLNDPRLLAVKQICNSYTMGCPPVRGDNPRALASGLS